MWMMMELETSSRPTRLRNTSRMKMMFLFPFALLLQAMLWFMVNELLEIIKATHFVPTAFLMQTVVSPDFSHGFDSRTISICLALLRDFISCVPTTCDRLPDI